MRTIKARDVQLSTQPRSQALSPFPPLREPGIEVAFHAALDWSLKGQEVAHRGESYNSSSENHRPSYIKASFSMIIIFFVTFQELDNILMF